MGLAHSPKIVTDGLSFMYDTGSGKSYKGEPTTNVNTFTLSDSGTDGSGQSSVGTRTVITNNHVRIVDTASNTRQTHVITGLTASTTYTVSIMYKKLVGTPTFRFQIQDYSGSSYLRTIKFTNTSEIGIEDKEGWQLASWTFTLGSDANAVRIWYQDGADYTTYTHSFELKNPQLEAKSHATPYVDGTRSSTQGLLDRTVTSTIDISNASFDSNAQMTFDGTDDYANVDHQSSYDTNVFTIEAWFKSTADDNTHDSIVTRNGDVYSSTNGWSLGKLRNGLGDTPNALRWIVWGTSAYTDLLGGSATTGNWIHAVGVSDGSTLYLYQNGVLKTSSSKPAGNIYPASYGLKVGANKSSSDVWNGYIDSVKMYNKALTASEVLQNYNALKSRFT